MVIKWEVEDIKAGVRVRRFGADATIAQGQNSFSAGFSSPESNLDVFILVSGCFFIPRMMTAADMVEHLNANKYVPA